MITFNTWLDKHNFKNFPTLIVALAFVIFIFMLIAFLNHNDEDSYTIYITRDTDLRTYPNAVYSFIKSTNLGQSYNKFGKYGKMIEVESSNHKDKGWVAGLNTNLNIQADANANEKPLKDKTIVLDPGHGGSDQGASS